MSKILESFPEGFEPREKQKDVLLQIEQSIKKGTKFIVVQCPTGTGKSHISTTLCNLSDSPDPAYVKLVDSNDIFKRNAKDPGLYEYAEATRKLPHWGAAVLTVSKQLQAQYLETFESCSILKGKSNYVCNLDQAFTVDVAPCTQSWKVGEQCLLENACAYYGDLKETLQNKFAVFNYSKYLTLPEFVRKRQFLICDEASELEDALVNHFSVQMKYKTLDYYDIPYNGKVKTDNIYRNLTWLENTMALMAEHIKRLQGNAYTKHMSKREKEKTKRSIKLAKELKESINNILRNSTSNFICQHDSEGVSVCPLEVDKLAQHLWGNHKHVILMSGTIFDHKTFTKTLGIQNYDYIEVDSEFDTNKNPVYIPAKYQLNYKNIDKNLPLVIKQAHDIADEFENENGIIHTHTNKITNAFDRATKDRKRYLFRKDNITNEHIVLEHVALGYPTVLVSPSMAFGVDLPDDMSRFQIVMKLPYPSLGDKRIKAMFDKDPKWYNMKMFTKLIQMCGRSTRTVDDFCDTYILDAAAISAIKRSWNDLPKWFTRRLK